jgi:hypothetical protein
MADIPERSHNQVILSQLRRQIFLDFSDLFVQVLEV